MAAVGALVDWYGVARGHLTLEYVAKPATLVALTLAAVLLDPADPVQRAAFVVALTLSLVGDVFLVLDDRWFVAGLAAFLLAHIAYTVGFLIAGVDVEGLLVGVAVTAALGLALGRRIVSGAAAELRAPVTIYIAFISLMVASALATRHPWAVTGALSFYLSDALIGWTRFVGDVRYARVAIMVTYHVGQGLLVVSLVA